MSITIELTDAGVDAFNVFFDAAAKPGVRREAVVFELIDVISDRFKSNETTVYELAAQYTVSGRPEHLTLGAKDINVIHEADK